MTAVQPFVFPETSQQVRTIIIDGEPWFVATDVAAVLELGNVHSSLSALDEDEKGLHSMETPRGQQEFATVSEPGLYSLILRSRKPQAKAFRRWVTHEVLPSIHRTGSYALAGEAASVAPGQAVVNALAELAHRQHVVPMAGRVLAYERWHKSDKGIAAFVQLTINLGVPGLDGGPAEVRELPARGEAA